MMTRFGSDFRSVVKPPISIDAFSVVLVFDIVDKEPSALFYLSLLVILAFSSPFDADTALNTCQSRCCPKSRSTVPILGFFNL